MGNFCNTSYSPRLSNKPISLQDFEILKFLGRGSFAKVLLVRSIVSGRLYALKVIKARGSGEMEHAVLSEMESPFIVKLHHSFRSEQKLFLILDLVGGGSLTQAIQQKGCLTQHQTAFFAAEILCVLRVLHSHGYIYRDLKPDNILLDDKGHIKISDLNLCTKQSSSFAGTIAYLPPEIIKGEKQTFAVDYWALGIVIYEMLHGVTPFSNTNPEQIIHNVLHKDPQFDKRTSPQARDIICQLLDKDFNSRMTDPWEITQHSFFEEMDWDLVCMRKAHPPIVPFSRYCSYSTGSSYNTDQLSNLSNSFK